MSNNDSIYVVRCLAQYRSHTKKRTDGSLLVRVEGGLWDLFQGNGFKNVSRFRVVKVRQTGNRSLIQVSGLNLNPALRALLLEECH
jgi:hypothetical protein